MADTPQDDNLAAVPGEHPASEGQAAARAGRLRIGLAAVAIMSIHLLAKLGGFVQKKVLAHFFGTGIEADAATGMEKIFSMIYYVPEELLTHSLLPVFTKLRNEEGEEAAWRMASLAGTLQALALVLVTAVLWLWPELAVRPLFKGWLDEPVKYEMTVQIVRVAMLGLFCTSLGSLTYVLLNAYKRFVSPAMGDVAQKAGIVIGTAVVVIGLGHEHPVGYAVGFILGGVFKLLTHLLALGPKLRLVRPGFDFRNPGLRRLGLLMLPLIGGTAVSRLRDLVETRFISEITVTGALASLDYAKKLVLMPVQVLPYALGIALFPYLAEWAQKHEKEHVTDAFLGASRMMFFVFVPMTVGFLLVGEEIITVLYKSGRFDEGSVGQTLVPFAVLALGMVFYALEMIALQVFYAHQDTHKPFLLGLAGSGLQLALDWLLALQLGFGVAGIAAAYAISKAVKVGLLWWQLAPRLSSFRWPALLSLVLKTAIASAVMAAVLLGLKQAGHRFMDLGSVKSAAVFLLAAGVAGGTAFVVTAALLRINELLVLSKLVLRKLRRGG